MVGLNPDFGKFLILCAYNVLANFVGFALGVCLACGFEVLEVALIVTPMILLPLMLFSGFFVNNDSIPVFLDWIKWLSPIKYAFEGMVKNEFEGTLYGDRVIQSLGLNDGLSVVICSLILLAMTTAFVLLSYYFLWRLISGGHGGPKKSKDAVAK
ncbi:ABC-2 type transporter-domain-containing protein [Entophlyctis helioformis]|nr:ABC-2 type transporter-domain-containing protein [Entophlyctis helioformis]